jgi:hypothetical protein
MIFEGISLLVFNITLFALFASGFLSFPNQKITPSHNGKVGLRASPKAMRFSNWGVFKEYLFCKGGQREL